MNSFTDGVTLTGSKTANGQDSGESRKTGAEGAKCNANLSGKRTENNYEKVFILFFIPSE